MEEIDIIELLKRVKEGKAPKKIEINGDIYTFFEENKYENDNDIEKLYEIQVGNAVWYWLKYNIINFNTKIEIGGSK